MTIDTDLATLRNPWGLMPDVVTAAADRVEAELSQLRHAESPAASETGWLHVRAYCICGAKLDARSDPPAAARDVHDMFRQIHSGDGHAPCDAATARRARKREPSGREGA